MRPIIIVQFLADIFQPHPCCFKGFSEVSKSMPVAENVEPRPADRKAATWQNVVLLLFCW